MHASICISVYLSNCVYILVHASELKYTHIQNISFLFPGYVCVGGVSVVPGVTTSLHIIAGETFTSSPVSRFSRVMGGHPKWWSGY